MQSDLSIDSLFKRAKNRRREGASFASELVGRKLHAMRKERKLSIRVLAEQSGLSVNTLSLIENGKTSPSVSTLQQLAQSLDVPITTFFENEETKRQVVYQKAGERQQYIFSQGHVESLGLGMPHMGTETLITRLEPGATSGDTPIAYAGREFVYCLEGHITYVVDNEVYPLSTGDSLLLEAHTPHSWSNTAKVGMSKALLVLCPSVSQANGTESYLKLFS